MENITQKLKLLQNITVDADFKSASKAKILATRRPFYRSYNIIFNLLTTVAIVTAFFVTQSIINVNNEGETIERLVAVGKESASAKQDINITLEEIDIFDKAKSKTASAMKAIHKDADSESNHLNPLLLELELENIDITTKESQVDALLKTITL